MYTANLNARIVSQIILFLMLTLLPLPQVTAQDMLGQRNTLNVWNVADGTLLRTIETETYIQQARLNSDATTIVATHDDGIFSAYDVESGDVLHTRAFVSAGNPRYTKTRSGLTANQIFVAQAKKFWLWDFGADEILLEGETETEITDILASPNGQRFLVISKPEQINVFDSADGERLVAIPALSRIWDIQWSPDSSRIALAHKAGFSVFNTETGENLLDVPDERGLNSYSRVTWSPDGLSLILLSMPSSEPEHTEIFVLESETLILRLSIPFDDGVYSIDWSADSSQIVTASWEKEGVSTYDAHTGNLIRRYGGSSSTDGFLFVGFSYDDTRVVGEGVSATRDVYSIWDAETGNLIYEFESHDSEWISPVWNETKTHILFSIWPSSIVDVFDLTQGDTPRLTLTHQDTLQGANWSSDGTRIVAWTGADRG